MRPRSARREAAKALVDRAIRSTLHAAGSGRKKLLARLVWNVQARSDLLRPRRTLGRMDAGPPEQLVGGLMALAGHSKDWLRPVETWEPAPAAPLPLFSSLAHHLLAEYPAPPVLLSGWFRGTAWPGLRCQNLFKHVGRGGSLRTARLPLAFTKRMAHEFAHAPAHFAIEFAFRWAQVRGLGGSDELARAVASTRLGQEFRNHDFWASAIHFFLNHPRLDLAQVGPIVEFLHDRKFEPLKAIIGDSTEIALEPAQPDYSLKGRTLASLLAQVAEWRSRRTDPPRRLFRWGRSPIGEYREDRADGPPLTILQLLDSDALAAEGSAMHHCVADYTLSCVEGTSTIWSMGLESSSGRERLLTIEVDPSTKSVVQASMSCNADPDDRAQAAMARWAKQEGITIDE